MNVEQRAEFLHNCVAQLVAAHYQFVKSRDEEITPKHAFYIAADALVDAFSGEAGDIPQKCWKLFLAVWGNGDSDEAGFKRAWNRYKADQDASMNPTWKLSQPVKSAYQNLCRAMKTSVAVQERLVDTVADLLGQGVTPQQIARIYRKFTRGGSYDIGWVQHMKEHPEENTPETRNVHKRQESQSTAQWDAYAAGLARQPEIIRVRELLEQGLDVEQVGLYSTEGQTTAKGPRFAFGEPEWQVASQTAWAGVTTPVPQPDAFQGLEGMPGVLVDEGGQTFTIEQQAVMMLDHGGITDEQIKQKLNISGQQLGAWKRRADEIRAELTEMAGV